MRSKLLVGMLGPAVVATLSAGLGCMEWGHRANSIEYSVARGFDAMAAKKIHDPPIPLAVNGTVAIDIESFSGDVDILVDGTAEYITVTPTRLATHGFGRGDEAVASLDEIYYTVELVPGPIDEVLEIRTGSTHPEPHFQAVDFEIIVPDMNGLRVHTANGHVVARNIRGKIEIVTSDGDVRVMTMRPIVERVTITNNSGDIDYRIRPESTAAFDCTAVRGSVHHRTSKGSIVVLPGTRHDRFFGALNDGENPVILKTTDGNIRVAVVDAPTHVGSVIID